LIIDEFDEGKLERIREICQQLFHQNYITEFVFAPNDALKKANDSYSFAMANYEAIEELLERCGWRLCHDRRVGVLYLDSDYAKAKVVLREVESYLLLAMRLLYDEKKTQASATGEVFVTVSEVLEQLTTLGAVKQVGKKERKKALRTLVNRNIIAKISGKLDELETRLAILPSVVCAISAEKTKAVVAMLASSKLEETEESAETEESEEDDL
jgi:hypothetical protein